MGTLKLLIKRWSEDCWIDGAHFFFMNLCQYVFILIKSRLALPLSNWPTIVHCHVLSQYLQACLDHSSSLSLNLHVQVLTWSNINVCFDIVLGYHCHDPLWSLPWCHFVNLPPIGSPKWQVEWHCVLPQQRIDSVSRHHNHVVHSIWVWHVLLTDHGMGHFHYNGV